MEPDMEYRLQCSGREQLLYLVRQLLVRHPQVESDILELLPTTEAGNALSMFWSTPSSDEEDEREEADDHFTDEWDYNDSDVEDSILAPQMPLAPVDLEASRQCFAAYIEVNAQVTPQNIYTDLIEIVKEAEQRANRRDYQGALELHALLIDERIAKHNQILTTVLDKLIDEALPLFETLLSEVSSHIMFDPTTTFSPMLSAPMRHRWLERLFCLWLDRLDAYHEEAEIPEIILDLAWSDDVEFLRAMVLKEMQLYPGEHSNIVDFTRQYRTRALDKFLKELPHV